MLTIVAFCSVRFDSAAPSTKPNKPWYELDALIDKPVMVLFCPFKVPVNALPLLPTDENPAEFPPQTSLVFASGAVKLMLLASM